MAESNNCLVCNSDSISFHLRCKDYFTSGENFEIYRCNNCGFEFTMNPPDESKIEKYYDTGEYISHSDTKKGITNFLFHSARSLMLYRKKSILKNATGLKTGSLLDIGCGTGYFPAFMKKNGWKVTGLEVNEKAREYAKEKFNLDVFTEDEFIAKNNDQFDGITLWHVFEHFHDPLKYLSMISSLLKKGGVCVVAIPNSASYDAGYFRNFWAAYDVPRHLWHFDPDNFRMFTENNGFILKKIKSLPLDVFYISILSEKYKGSKPAFLLGMMKGLLFTLLTLFNRKKSSSVIYIFRKI